MEYRTNNMTKNKATQTTTFLAVAASLAGVANLQAQSSDALLNKLVQKGILTEAEAKDLRQESDKESAKTTSSNLGLPDWVNSLKLSGDFRGRLDYMGSDNSLVTDRYRFRYRVRAGLTAKLVDDFEINLTLGSSDDKGNALSNNATLENNGTKKPIYIDKVYAKWTPLHDGEWTVSSTIGKMALPFQATPMEFDPDYTPEGAAFQVGYKISDQHNLQFNSAAFVLDELSASSHDPYLLGGQALWNAKWPPKLESSLGIAIFGIGNNSGLSTANVPNNNAGNTRDAAGNLVYHYNPYVLSGNLTYKFDSFPLYKGAFPVSLGGDYMNNPAADNNNQAYWAGMTFGKAGKRGNWDLSYRYQRLEADAWYEELVDDDNAGFYQTAQTGGKSGLTGGTNIKGHLVKLNYSITDALTFTVTGYFNDLINESPDHSKSGGTHIMADLMWKF